MDNKPYMRDLNCWCIPTGQIIDCPNSNSYPPPKVKEYKETDKLPVFYGEWTIDEANTTATGKQYFSNVLIDLE